MPILLFCAGCGFIFSSDPIDDVTGCYIYNGPGYDDKACFNGDGTFIQSKSTGEGFTEYYHGQWHEHITTQKVNGKPFIAIVADEMQLIENHETGELKTSPGVYIKPEQYTKTRILYTIYTDAENLLYLKVLDE